MKHKYNIEHLLQSIIGYKGLPYPGAFSPNRPAGSYTGDNFDIPTSPAPQQELVKGTTRETEPIEEQEGCPGQVVLHARIHQAS